MLFLCLHILPCLYQSLSILIVFYLPFSCLLNYFLIEFTRPFIIVSLYFGVLCKVLWIAFVAGMCDMNKRALLSNSPSRNPPISVQHVAQIIIFLHWRGSWIKPSIKRRVLQHLFANVQQCLAGEQRACKAFLLLKSQKETCAFYSQNTPVIPCVPATVTQRGSVMFYLVLCRLKSNVSVKKQASLFPMWVYLHGGCNDRRTQKEGI